MAKQTFHKNKYGPHKAAPKPLTVHDYDGGPFMHISEFVAKQKELYGGVDPNKLEFTDKGKVYDTWVTSDGIVLQMHQMSNRHLFNAIRYLARKGKRSSTLEFEMQKRLRQHAKIADRDAVYVPKVPAQPSRNILRLKPCHSQDGPAS